MRSYAMAASGLLFDYLTDTTRENGCLRVIPGSHRKWHPLHDFLPNAHEEEIQKLKDTTSFIFAEAEGSVDVPTQAGDLVIADARLLHSAWGNQTSERRTLILAWYNCFQFPRPPSWWVEAIPRDIETFDGRSRYVFTRVPNIPWKSRGNDFHAKWGPEYEKFKKMSQSSLDSRPSHLHAKQLRDILSNGVDESKSSSGHEDGSTRASSVTCVRGAELNTEDGLMKNVAIVWHRYKTLDGQRFWWWCELDGDWFFEDQLGSWMKYKDLYSGRHYWWKNDDVWFWLLPSQVS